MEDSSLVPSNIELNFIPKNGLFTLSDFKIIKSRLLFFRVEKIRLVIKIKLSKSRKKIFEKRKDLTNTLELFKIEEEPEKLSLLRFFGCGTNIYQDILKLKQALFFIG